MKLAIFGASGRTGLPLLEQALQQGHEVKTLVRNPSKLNITHDHLTVIQGDATDPTAVETTITGSEAVLTVLGHTKSSTPDIMTVATRNILAAMQHHHITD